MEWKNKNICYCSYNHDHERIKEWIYTCPDFEDKPSPCYFCVIDVAPELFENEFGVKISELPDIYCPECKIPKKSIDVCLQQACPVPTHHQPIYGEKNK